MTLSTRLMISHVLVATVLSVLMVLLILVGTITSNILTSGDQMMARLSAITWLFPAQDASSFNLPPGSTVILSPDHNRVEYVDGQHPCEVGMSPVECLGDTWEHPGTVIYKIDRQAWSRVVEDTSTGYRIISERQRLTSSSVLRSIIPATLGLIIISIPLAIGLTLLSAGRLTRRLRTITEASRQFASGNFAARVIDHRQDDLGQLAQQFNSMADALAQNVAVLRELAQRNTALADQVEQAAIQAERTRLSRDLHDDIAQQLFSLSLSSAALPDAIRRDPAAAVSQAENLAALAEKTLLGLRALIVDLRPTTVIQHGFSDALEKLCESWSETHHIPVECSLVLAGKHITAGIEDVLYRSTQEALTNIAHHAGATLAAVSLLEGQRQLHLSISDNGRGLTAPPGEGHFGLIGIRERVRSVGGQFSIESQPQQGTTLHITIPLQREDEA